MNTSPLPSSPENQTASTEPQRTSSGTSTLIRLCAIGLFISFFLPWISFFGGRLSGLDIQRDFSSYQLVCVMPILAAIALALNLAGRDINLIRRMAGLVPFVILVVALNRHGSELLRVLSFGALLSLICGLLLILPFHPKQHPHATDK